MPLDSSVPDYDWQQHDRIDNGKYIGQIYKYIGTVKPKWSLKVMEKGSWQVVEHEDSFATLTQCRLRINFFMNQKYKA